MIYIGYLKSTLNILFFFSDCMFFLFIFLVGKLTKVVTHPLPALDGLVMITSCHEQLVIMSYWISDRLTFVIAHNTVTKPMKCS